MTDTDWNYRRRYNNAAKSPVNVEKFCLDHIAAFSFAPTRRQALHDSHDEAMHLETTIVCELINKAAAEKEEKSFDEKNLKKAVHDLAEEYGKAGLAHTHATQQALVQDYIKNISDVIAQKEEFTAKQFTKEYFSELSFAHNDKAKTPKNSDNLICIIENNLTRAIALKPDEMPANGLIIEGEKALINAYVKAGIADDEDMAKKLSGLFVAQATLMKTIAQGPIEDGKHYVQAKQDLSDAFLKAGIVKNQTLANQYVYSFEQAIHKMIARDQGPSTSMAY